MPTSLSERPQLQYLTAQIDELKAKGTHFRLRILDNAQAPVCTYDGRCVINLASNNYLGLCNHPKLREAATQAIKDYGVGSGAVRTIAGTMKIHMELEEKIARFKNVEACVVFQSGFTANAGTVSALLGKEDFIVSDELNHASIIDGARLSRAKIKVFRHKDVAHAEELLREIQNEPGRKLLITDGVFSMDGDIGPVDKLADLAEKYGAIMMVDDAHASGVLGRNGRGSIDHFHCHGRVDIQVGTLSKAIGAIGGYVCGSTIARAHSSSPPRIRPRSQRPASPPSTFWNPSPSASTACGTTPATSKLNWAASASTSAASTPRRAKRLSRRSSLETAAKPWTSRAPYSKRESSAPASPSLLSPKAKPASAPS